MTLLSLGACDGTQIAEPYGPPDIEGPEGPGNIVVVSKRCVDEDGHVIFEVKNGFDSFKLIYLESGNTVRSDSDLNPRKNQRGELEDLSDGTYRLDVVRNNQTRSVNFTIDCDVHEPENRPPVARFSYDTDELVVDFTDQSFDPDGSVVDWVWEFGDGETANVQHPTHKYAEEGTYPVTLTVTDNDGATDQVTRDVTVSEPENLPPTARFDFETDDLTVDFDGSDSFDPDGSIVEYEWEFGDGETGSGVTPTHTYPEEGTYSVTLTVTDNDGATDDVTKDVPVSEPECVTNYDQINRYNGDKHISGRDDEHFSTLIENSPVLREQPSNCAGMNFVRFEVDVRLSGNSQTDESFALKFVENGSSVYVTEVWQDNGDNGWTTAVIDIPLDALEEDVRYDVVAVHEDEFDDDNGVDSIHFATPDRRGKIVVEYDYEL